MDISIIIVSWKVKEKLRTNLQSLLPSLVDLNAEVYVVDNASDDGTVEMLQSEFPQVKLIANADNRGFAKANNQAIKEASGNFILLLNPDMLVFPETIKQMLVWAKSEARATVSSCRLVTESGQNIPHVRSFPGFFDQAAVILKLPHLFPRILEDYLQAKFDYAQPARVDSVRGALFLINRSSWEKLTGQVKPFLDEQYFIWFEEVDFCRQVYKNGGEVWYSPVASCIDYVGQSFGQVKISTKQKYFQESMLKYFYKWQPRWQFYLLKTMWPVGKLMAKIFT